MEGKVPSAPQCAILLTINMFVLFIYFFIFLDWVSRCFSALRITFAAEGGAYTSKGRGMFSLSKHVLLHLTEHWKQKLLLDFIAEGAALPI